MQRNLCKGEIGVAVGATFSGEVGGCKIVELFVSSATVVGVSGSSLSSRLSCLSFVDEDRVGAGISALATSLFITSLPEI